MHQIMVIKGENTIEGNINCPIVVFWVVYTIIHI